MNQAVNSLIIELLKQPIFLLFFLIGIIYILYIIVKNVINNKKELKETPSENMQKENTCPNCGGVLKLRNGKCGNFYGCSNYPKCKYTKNI